MANNRLILNKKELSRTKDEKQLLAMLEAGIKAVLPEQILPAVLKYNARKKILSIKNKKYKIKGKIFVIGGGKAAGRMAEALEKIIPSNQLQAGIVNCQRTDYKTKKIKINRASHPLPNSNGVKGVEQILAMRDKYKINKDDLIICLISGGGSAMLPYPKTGINLKDKQLITKLLISSGANIQEINAVRKHLSGIKGGQLAKFFAPAKIISLIISDVIGNDLQTIASGITAPDKSTYNDAYNILKKYKLFNKTPKNIVQLIKQGKTGRLPETAKKLNNADNFILADNMHALRAIAANAKTMGYKPFIVKHSLTGETKTAAKNVAKKIIQGVYKTNLIILGGETSPTLPRIHGQGGRNQHFAACSLQALNKIKNNWLMASLGSDGTDFLDNVGGAIVGRQTLKNIKNKNIQPDKYIKRFDSYNLFKKIGGCLIKMAKTGTNVGDIVIYML